MNLSTQMNLSARVRDTAVITKKCSDHEIFIMNVYIHVIFSNFTKILCHKIFEVYGI